jgi:integrase
MYTIYVRDQARRRKARGIWWIRWDFRGVSKKESLFTTDRDEAEKRAAERWAEITAGKGDCQRAAAYTFKQAVEDYGGEERFVDMLKIALGDRPLASIDSALLTKVGRTLYPGVHTRTIHRNVFTPFSAVFNRAAEDHKVPWRKFPKPKLTKAERDAEKGTDPVKFVSDDYLVTWLSHSSVTQQLRAIALLGTYTAARATIAVTLEWRQVNMAERAVYVGKEKNDQPRRVVMHPELFQALLALPEGAPNERVFGFNDRFALADAVRATQEAAGLDPHGFHQIGRHTFAARYLAQGHNLRQLMEAGGWRTYKAVLIYAHLERKTVDQTIRDLPGLQPKTVLLPVLKILNAKNDKEI